MSVQFSRTAKVDLHKHVVVLVYNYLMSLFRLHFIWWYFLMTEGTIILSQISLLLAPSGIIKWCIQSEYKLFFLSGRISFHPSLRNLNLKKGIANRTDSPSPRGLFPLPSTSTPLAPLSCSFWITPLILRALQQPDHLVLLFDLLQQFLDGVLPHCGFRC